MSVVETPLSHNFDALYMDHHRWLSGWLRQRLNCSETAADIAQDTFLRLLQRDREGILVRQPRAYLTRIARSLIINHWRRKEIERAYLEALMMQPELRAPSPEEHHQIIESLLEVDAMLSNLPDKVREAFLMSRLEGLTYARIAQKLGCSERTVKNYMSQAMYHCLLLDADLVSFNKSNSN